LIFLLLQLNARINGQKNWQFIIITGELLSRARQIHFWQSSIFFSPKWICMKLSNIASDYI